MAMFTGVIKEIGILQRREKKDENLLFTIRSPLLINTLKPGASVAVNGVCLTVEQILNDSFKVSIMPETVLRTNLGMIRVSSRVNIEPAMPADGKFDGHIVTGHIDVVGKVMQRGPKEGGLSLKVQFPQHIAKYLSLKGSISINGVSLTIMDLGEDTLTVGLIPFTQENTNLGSLQADDLVNLEIDVIARYLERLLQGKENEIKHDWLKERNFI